MSNCSTLLWYLSIIVNMRVSLFTQLRRLNWCVLPSYTFG